MSRRCRAADVFGCALRKSAYDFICVRRIAILESASALKPFSIDVIRECGNGHDFQKATLGALRAPASVLKYASSRVNPDIDATILSGNNWIFVL
jgi:hypothetical protein